MNSASSLSSPFQTAPLSVRKSAITRRVATLSFAFLVQYGVLFNPHRSPVQAAPLQGLRLAAAPAMSPSSELGTLDFVDRDLYQVDPIHSVENGLTILHGAPVLLKPIIDTTDASRVYFDLHEGYGALGGEYSDRIEGLSKMFSFLTPEKKILYPDAVGYVETAEWMEKELQMTNSEKIRHYYGMIYFWSAMLKWKWEKSSEGMWKETDVSKMNRQDPKVKKFIEILNSDKEDSEIARYTALLNEVLDQPEYKGKPKYERMRGEAKLMKLLDLVNNFANLAADADVIRKDLVNFVDREGYLDYLDSGLTLFEETMKAFEAGDPDVTRDFLGVQRRLIHTVFVEDRRFAKAFDALPPMKMMEKSYQSTLLAIKESTEKRVFQLLKRYHALMEKPHAFTNKQDYVMTLLYADDLLKYAEAVAKHDSISAVGPGKTQIIVTAGEVKTFLDSVLATTQAIQEKYPSMKDLLLPDTTVDNVTQVARRVNAALPRYTAISDGDMATVGPRLAKFMAKTTNAVPLSASEKKELQALFQSVQNSPVREQAQKQLAAAMGQFVYLAMDGNKTHIRVERTENTGFTYDFKLNPVYLERNGVGEMTTVQPADKLHAQYTFVNKLRFDIPVHLRIYYPNTRVVMQNQELLLRANSETRVPFSTILSAVNNPNRGRENLPEYELHFYFERLPQMLGYWPSRPMASISEREKLAA